MTPNQTDPSILIIPVDGVIVTLNVPPQARTLVARTLLTLSGLHRRTDKPIRSPKRWAARVVGTTLADPAAWPVLLEQLDEHIVTADRLAPDSRDVDAYSLHMRVFEGRLEDNTTIDPTLVNTALLGLGWDLIGHQPHQGRSCTLCALFLNKKFDAFGDCLRFNAVLVRLLHAELVLAKVLPPYRLVRLPQDALPYGARPADEF